MVRGKTELKRIENAASRQVTFSKRKNGLLKKAFELSVLCDSEVALLIFSPKGKLYEFASSSNINKTIERYNQKRAKDAIHNSNKEPPEDPHEPQLLASVNEEDSFSMAKKIEDLELSKRKFLGECLEPCSMNELQQVESQLERSLSKIRARKNQLYKESIEKLKEEERLLLEQNTKLREKCGMLPKRPSTEQEVVVEQNQKIEVETELFIGQPKGRN